jgi:hypothetical protein
MSATAEHVRHRALPALVLVLALVLAGEVVAQKASEPSASEWRSIRSMITAQRRALVDGDGEKAFRYASPGIRAQFGDGENFLAMVHAGYEPLLSARRVKFLEGAVIDGAVIQPLQLEDTDGTVRVALYTLERQRDGSWRISGCQIAPSTLRSAQTSVSSSAPKRRA